MNTWGKWCNSWEPWLLPPKLTVARTLHSGSWQIYTQSHFIRSLTLARGYFFYLIFLDRSNADNSCCLGLLIGDARVNIHDWFICQVCKSSSTSNSTLVAKLDCNLISRVLKMSLVWYCIFTNRLKYIFISYILQNH